MGQKCMGIKYTCSKNTGLDIILMRVPGLRVPTRRLEESTNR